MTFGGEVKKEKAAPSNANLGPSQLRHLRRKNMHRPIAAAQEIPGDDVRPVWP